MEAYHYFWDPEELEVDDEGFLMFLEDEEEQFTWGFRVGDLGVPDPIVYRRNNARGQWKSEEGTFSRVRLRHVRVGLHRRGRRTSPVRGKNPAAGAQADDAQSSQGPVGAVSASRLLR